MSIVQQNDSFWLKIIYIISVVITAAVAFLILGPRPEGLEGALDVSLLPTVNALLNGITTRKVMNQITANKTSADVIPMLRSLYYTCSSSISVPLKSFG